MTWQTQVSGMWYRHPNYVRSSAGRDDLHGLLMEKDGRLLVCDTCTQRRASSLQLAQIEALTSACLIAQLGCTEDRDWACLPVPCSCGAPGAARLPAGLHRGTQLRHICGLPHLPAAPKGEADGEMSILCGCPRAGACMHFQRAVHSIPDAVLWPARSKCSNLGRALGKPRLRSLTLWHCYPSAVTRCSWCTRCACWTRSQ